MSVSAVIEHEGKTYVAEIATIESADLGFEDHGILGWNLAFKGPSWGQGSGWRGLGFDTPYGTHVINEVLKAVGARRWDDVKGKRVFVLREKDRFGPILGISNLDGDRVLLWDSISEKAGIS